MLADLYQGDDQPAGETQRNIPSEDDDGYVMDDLLSMMAMSWWKVYLASKSTRECHPAMDYPL